MNWNTTETSPHRGHRRWGLQTPLRGLLVAGLALALAPGACGDDDGGTTSEATTDVATTDATTTDATTTDATTTDATTTDATTTDATTTDPTTTTDDPTTSTTTEDPTGDPTSESESTGEPAAVCGDGIVEGDEECDDGNADNTDECLDTCEWATCGDGFVHQGVEECDNGSGENTEDCTAECLLPTCDDGLQNGGETDVDCGGPCDPCGLGLACAGAEDCEFFYCAMDLCAVAPTCKALLAAAPDLESGVYTLDPDGDGDLEPMAATCDMETDGGGWTLVLNYLHLGGTNPALGFLSDRLPLEASTELGEDESASPTAWGHTIPALLSKIALEEFRLYGRTSGHGRVIHFKTSLAGCVAYFRTGSGSCSGLALSFTGLPGHTAFIPGQINNQYSNQGDQALTNFPFYRGGTYHWGIRGLGNRWEVDNYPNNATLSTHHQIWVR